MLEIAQFLAPQNRCFWYTYTVLYTFRTINGRSLGKNWSKMSFAHTNMIILGLLGRIRIRIVFDVFAYQFRGARNWAISCRPAFLTCIGLIKNGL